MALAQLEHRGVAARRRSVLELVDLALGALRLPVHPSIHRCWKTSIRWLRGVGIRLPESVRMCSLPSARRHRDCSSVSEKSISPMNFGKLYKSTPPRSTPSLVTASCSVNACICPSRLAAINARPGRFARKYGWLSGIAIITKRYGPRSVSRNSLHKSRPPRDPGQGERERSEDPASAHAALYVESMIMLSTSSANRISPAHAQLTFNIIKRSEEDRPAGSVSDPTLGGQ
jgi:hypothetical protein